jgi:hypothetical protein
LRDCNFLAIAFQSEQVRQWRHEAHDYRPETKRGWAIGLRSAQAIDEGHPLNPSQTDRRKVLAIFKMTGLYALRADTSRKLPGGGLGSTVEDLARYAIAVQSGVLVHKAALDIMTSDG